MNSKYLRISCMVLAIFVIQISCKSLAEVEEVKAPKEVEVEVTVPEAGHVKENVESPAGVPQPQPETTRRPGIVLGIWNGIVRAPVEIANRVQGIFAGINARRNATTTAAPKPPVPTPAKVVEEVKLVN